MDAYNYDALKSALLGPVQQVVNTKDERTEAALGRLEKVFGEVAAKIDKLVQVESDSARQHAAAAIDSHKDAFKKGGGAKSLGKMGENTFGSKKALERIVKMGSSPRTFWVGVGHYNTKALNQLTDAFKAAGCCPGGGSGATSALIDIADKAGKAGATSKVGGMMGTATGEDIGGGAGGVSGAAMNALKHTSKAWLTSLLAGAGNILAGALSSGFELNLTDAFSGAFRAANNFRMEIRAIKQATDGFVESNRAMEPTFQGLYHTLRASGVTANKVFEMISKAQKIGIRDSKIAQSIVGTATNTASILGMEAGVVNDIFMGWHQQLGLSTMELATMGQSMKEIAKQSGVMGKRLENALASADKIAEKLRNAGVFTAAAGRNVTALTVEFEKFGVGPAGAKILDALSSRHSFLETDPITRGYLERVARQSGNGEIQQRVRGGTLLHSPTASKEFFGAMEKDMRRMLGHFGPAIEGVFAKSGRKLDLTTMKMEQIPEIFRVLEEQGEHQLYGVISDLIKRQTGMDVGEITRMAEAGQNATKTTGERIKDMEKELAGFVKGSDNYRQKEQQILQAQVNEMQAGFTELYSLQKNRGAMGEAKFQENLVKRLEATMGPDRAREFAKNLSGEATKMVQGVVKRADTVGINANKVIKEIGGYRSMEDLAMGVSKGDKNAQETMNKLIQRIEQQEKVAADPIESIKDNVKGIHDWLTTGIFGTLKAIGDTALSILGWVALLGPATFAVYNIWKMVSLFGKAKNFLGNLMGRGGAGGAGGAGTTALSRTAGGTGRIIYTESRALAGTAEVAAETGGAAGGLLGRLTGVLGKLAGPLQLLIGGVTGYFEAEGAKRTKGEGTLLGMLTGGADTGSMFSGMLGIEKGSTADKTLGVAGGAAWGGAAGLAIGAALAPFTAGISVPVAGAIGAIVGAASEILKIITDGTTLIYDILIKPFDAIWIAVKDTLGGMWDIVAGLFTLDPVRMLEGFGDIAMAIPNMIKRILEWIVDLPGNLIKLLWTGIKKTASFIWTSITGAIKSLAQHEIFGPIFKPFLEVITVLEELGTEVYNIFADIYSVFEPIIEAFGEIKKAIFGTTSGAGFLKDILKGVASAIGFVIEYGLKPFIWTIKTITGFVRDVVGFVKDIPNKIAALGDVLYDTFSNAFAKVWNFIMDFVPGGGFFKKDMPQEAAAAGGVGAAAAAAGQPLQGFASGTSNITQEGLAYIHRGETIIPEEMSLARGEPMSGIQSNMDALQQAISANFAEGTKMVASFLGLDKEPLRGEMATNNMHYDDVEDAVAKQVYGESPDGSALILPSMDTIAEYLTTTQSMLLENMIELMEAIKSNTAGSYAPSIVGSDGGGSRVSLRPGVKSIARDLTRGKWDLTFADNAPGAVTTEGRGGSA